LRERELKGPRSGPGSLAASTPGNILFYFYFYFYFFSAPSHTKSGIVEYILKTTYQPYINDAFSLKIALRKCSALETVLNRRWIASVVL